MASPPFAFKSPIAEGFSDSVLGSGDSLHAHLRVLVGEQQGWTPGEEERGGFKELLSVHSAVSRGIYYFTFSRDVNPQPNPECLDFLTTPTVTAARSLIWSDVRSQFPVRGLEVKSVLSHNSLASVGQCLLDYLVGTDINKY